MARYSVLLIEGNLEQGALVSDYLNRTIREPLEIVCCKNYEEAFGPLFCGDWDLILINYELSRQNGFETLRRVKNLVASKNTPTIIYHTSSVQMDRVTEVIREGANDFLTHDDLNQPEGVTRLTAYLTKSKNFEMAVN